MEHSAEGFPECVLNSESCRNHLTWVFRSIGTQIHSSSKYLTDISLPGNLLKNVGAKTILSIHTRQGRHRGDITSPAHQMLH